MPHEKKHIVILGAGFGGLRAARKIARGITRHALNDKYEVVLIDKSEHHTFTPLLYEVAATSKETADICELHRLVAYPITTLISDTTIFIKKSVAAIDTEIGMLTFRDGTKIHADYLLFAAGAETHYYNIPGLEQCAFPLKTFSDAIRIREKLWELISEKTNELTIIIGGGGSTGVELAGELKMWCGELEKNSSACRINILILEASQSILSGFSHSVVSRARNRLERLGITIAAECSITQVKQNAISLASGKEIPYSLFLWTGGVKASSLLASMPFKIETKGRTEVAGTLHCIAAKNGLLVSPQTYAIGDAVCFHDPVTQKPVPGVARAALSQANVAAHNIMEDVKIAEGITRNASYKIFRPRNYPYIIPIGGKYAIAKIGPFTLSGIPAWIIKGLVEFNYLLSIMTPVKALSIWLKGLWIFSKNDRLG